MADDFLNIPQNDNILKVKKYDVDDSLMLQLKMISAREPHLVDLPLTLEKPSTLEKIKLKREQ